MIRLQNEKNVNDKYIYSLKFKSKLLYPIKSIYTRISMPRGKAPINQSICNLKLFSSDIC